MASTEFDPGGMLKPNKPPEGKKGEFVQNKPVPRGREGDIPNEGQKPAPRTTPRVSFPNEDNQFQFFPLEEKDFLDGINAELAGLVGVDAEYFVNSRVGTEIDPFYDEPEGEWKFDKSFRLRVFYIPDQGDPVQREPGERGLNEFFPGEVVIGRRIAEEVGLGAPKEGDAIRLFHPEGRGFADYDIVKVNPDPASYWGDQGLFLQFSCQVVRREKFIPERRFSKGNEPKGVTESDSDPRNLSR